MPIFAATAATIRVWFDWTPPIDTSVSAFEAMASGTIYSSFRSLFPPYANPDEIIRSIADRAQGHDWHSRHPELGTLTRLPLKRVEDHSSVRGGSWFTCWPVDGTQPEGFDCLQTAVESR